MTRGSRRWARAGVPCAVALLCGAWLVAVRADEPQAPEPLETELIRARSMIINASSKLRNDVVGVAPGEGGAATVARSCCSGNLKHIEAAVRESARILQDFDRCYEQHGDTDMVLRARVVLSDLSTFAQSLPAFADANGKREAQAALTSTSRAYNILRETAVGLANCDDVAWRPASATKSDAQKSDTGRKKDGKKQPK